MLNLIAIWRAHGLDTILRHASEKGIVLAGVSAGSMCWFEYGITTSTGSPGPATGLGLLPGSNCVHYDVQPDRRPIYHHAIATGLMPGGWGVDDGAALVFENHELVDVVCARPGTGARRVDNAPRGVVERRLPGRLLAPPAQAHAGDSSVGELRQLRTWRSTAPGRA